MWAWKSPAPAQHRLERPVLGQVLGAVLYSNQSGKAQKATDAQANLANTAADIFKQQAAIDLPFRTATMSGLLDRSHQKFPRFMPGSPSAALNPMAGGRQPQYPGAGGQRASGPAAGRDFQSILQALQGGNRAQSSPIGPLIKQLLTQSSGAPPGGAPPSGAPPGGEPPSGEPPSGTLPGGLTEDDLSRLLRALLSRM